MKPPQVPVCSPAEPFPETIANRPGLDRIRYRIGDYANVRRWLLEQLDRSDKLAAWTYRGADDPGIALYEGAALLIDSLTFYQEAYANEAFLRTATWRESVADLVRLLGYRLLPGIGGVGTFAFEIKGDKPVTIPAGVAIQAKLASKNADFQTSEQIVALPALSKLTLTRPQLPKALVAGDNQIVASTSLKLQKGDRLLVGVAASAAPIPLAYFETVVVESTTPWHDRTLVTLAGGIHAPAGYSSLTVAKLDRTFHFPGYNAPAQYTVFGADTHLPTTTCTAGLDPQYDNYVELDPQVNDLAVGSWLALNGAGGMWIVKVTSTASITEDVGPLTVPVTRAYIEGSLSSAGSFGVRSSQVDSIVGSTFTATNVWTDLDTPRSWLFWWGNVSQAASLKGRRLGIAPVDKQSFEVVVLDVVPIAALGFSLVKLDREVDFADFADGNTTVVYGNLCDVTEGKQAPEAVLGNGDDGATFQSFQIPKAPLTYLDRPALTPPDRPEIEIVVGGRVWSYVDVLYGMAPDAEVYIVRQDDAGNSWVQFGDGKTGARLPSGVDNVVVRYRTGAGAFGALADGAKASADRIVPQVTGVDLVGVIAGGSAPEDMSTAKIAAPARVQSLDRIVSISDVEAEALEIGGVAKARAVWTIVSGLSLVQVTLLMQPGRTAELGNARTVLATANCLRGPQRFPIVVVPGAFEYVYLDLTLSIDPTYDPQPVRAAVEAALGVSGGPLDGSAGLFGDRSSRSFGDPEYATRIEGIAQNVGGVQWALVNAFGSLGVADDPALLTYPPYPTRVATVACASTHVLRLYNAGDGGPLILRTVTGAS